MQYIASPNYQVRLPGQSVDFLIIHYTECDLNLALKLLTDAHATKRVSAHYLISENGDVIQLVKEDNVAWHAGQSYWAGRTSLNQCSIGIELVNPGHSQGYQSYPLAQMAALIELSQDILSRHPIPPQHVLGHSDIAPQRKRDPGELFDWDFLAKYGVGIAPTAVASHGGKGVGSTQEIITKLGEIGYEIPSPLTDEQLARVVYAFQMHFNPTARFGTLCPETSQRIARLHELIVLGKTTMPTSK